jgi:hypothetical protein
VQNVGAPGIILDVGLMFMPGPKREINYQANKAVPNVVIDFNSMAGLYFAGYVGMSDFKNEASYLGLKIGDTSWSSIKYARDNHLQWPDEPMAIWNSSHGSSMGDWYGTILHNMSYRPTNDEAMVMFNRKLIDDKLFTHIIKNNTVAEHGWEWVFNDLRKVIPPVSDLISFSVREAFNSEVIQKYEYNKELPLEILPWLEKQGLQGGTNFPMPPGATTTGGADNRQFAQWYDHYWWSHWQLPSLTMGYEMLHRLYPTSRYGPSPDVTKNDGSVDERLAFIADDMDTLHKTQDYPPYWRKRLSAMSYLPLTRTDVRRMRQIGVFKDSREVYHAYRAIGYNDQNAQRLSEFTEELVKPKNRKLSQSTARAICENLTLNIISESTAKTELIATGYSDSDAQAYIVKCRIDKQRIRMKERLKTIRRLFLTGRKDGVTIGRLLDRYGFENSAEIVDNWRDELNLKYRELTLAQLSKQYKDDTIAVEVLNSRLDKLGYQADDRMAIIAELDKEKEEKSLRDVRSGYAYFTPKVLGKLFNDGILFVDDIRHILMTKGWNEYSIETFILEQGME